MEHDSLLVRGLVDSASRGLSPALDRSTTFERVPGGTSPYGRGHAPVAAEAEALLGALEDAHAVAFASGMTAWTCICLGVLGQGKPLVIPTSGYYEVELLGAEVLARCATSLGGFETLIERRARIEPEGRVPEGLLRLAVGLENVDDLWADLAGAIAASARPGALASAGASDPR